MVPDALRSHGENGGAYAYPQRALLRGSPTMRMLAGISDIVDPGIVTRCRRMPSLGVIINGPVACIFARSAKVPDGVISADPAPGRASTCQILPKHFTPTASRSAATLSSSLGGRRQTVGSLVSAGTDSHS